MALTLDIWSIPPESARRVGHPAPFPVELPEQLIRLYTFTDDLVLDPFMGSGSALVAAARLGRRYVGYDLDPAYVDIARRRVARGRDRRADAAAGTPATPSTSAAGPSTDGKAARTLAEEVLVEAGFTIVATDHRVRKTGVTVDFVATDADGRHLVLRRRPARSPATAAGCCAPTPCGSRSVGPRALERQRGDVPLVFLTTHLPRRPSEGDTALRAAGPDAFFDAIDMLSPESRRRLASYAAGGRRGGPQPGFWTAAELDRCDDVPIS